jgi:hypothetical protein
LFFFHNILVFWSLALSLTPLAANVHILHVSSVPIAITSAFGIALITVLLWLGVGRFVRTVASNIDLT